MLKHWVQTAAGNRIQEGDRASRHRGWSKEPQQRLWSDQMKISLFTSSLAVRWMAHRWWTRHSKQTPRSFKALQAHEQKLLVLPSGGLLLAQALSGSGQWVEYEGAICRAKHISTWHVLVQDMQNCMLRIYSLPLTYLHDKHIHELGVIFISD